MLALGQGGGCLYSVNQWYYNWNLIVYSDRVEALVANVCAELMSYRACIRVILADYIQEILLFHTHISWNH